MPTKGGPPIPHGAARPLEHGFTLHPELNLLVTRFAGRVTGSEFLACYRSIYDDPAYVPGMGELVDLSEADTIRFSMADLKAIRDLTARVAGSSDSVVHTAIVVASDLAYGMSRMYEVFAEMGPEDVAIFRDAPSALRWLSVPEDEWGGLGLDLV
jgi:hypothetical protein